MVNGLAKMYGCAGSSEASLFENKQLMTMTFVGDDIFINCPEILNHLRDIEVEALSNRKFHTSQILLREKLVPIPHSA